MAITGIDPSSYYSDYYSQATNASSSALENTLSKVGSETTEAELMEACKEFEAYFIEQIYKGMEKTIMKAKDEEITKIIHVLTGNQQFQSVHGLFW